VSRQTSPRSASDTHPVADDDVVEQPHVDDAERLLDRLGNDFFM
jgi:hypothetical protein